MNQLPERDLPPGRHRLLKERLMTEIRQEPERRTGKWLRPALVAGAVAAVAAVTLTLTAPSGEPASGSSAEPTRRSSAEPTPRSWTEASALLEDIALAAGEAKAPAIRDDQFVYVRSKVSWTGYDGSKETATIEPVREREAWFSVDGSQKGMAHDPYRDLDHELLDARYDGSYRYLQTLPTDTDKMYDWLNRNSQGGNSKDEANFVLVGELSHESLMPPEQAAALYRAAARIPGVFVIDDAVDADGRHGVAVARIGQGERQELIFDKRTMEFLGERAVAVEDGSMGIKKGDVTARTAVLERAVVDERGERP